MSRRRKIEPGMIVIDVRPFIRACGRLADAFRSRGETLRLLQDPRYVARRRVVGSGDLRTDDWQTIPCSAWLHASCPATPAMDCRCTCHGGHLR